MTAARARSRPAPRAIAHACAFSRWRARSRWTAPAVGAVEGVEEAILVRVDQRLDILPVDREVREDHLVYAVVIPDVVRRSLEVPLQRPVIGVERDDRIGVRLSPGR